MDVDRMEKTYLIRQVFEIKAILGTFPVFSFIANPESLLSRYLLLAEQRC